MLPTKAFMPRLGRKYFGLGAGVINLSTRYFLKAALRF